MTRPTIFEPGHERRQTDRKRRLKQACLSYGNGNISSSALLRDVSDKGARLETENSHFLPAAFNLMVASEGFEKNCKIIWRDMDALGVTFLD